MNKIRVGIHGAQGRMGIEVGKVVQGFDDLELLINFENAKPQVIIDFTSPKGAIEISNWCAAHKVPLVTGTTGLGESEEKKLREASKKIPVLQSPNMSLGINALARAIQSFLRMTPHWDAAIEDIHHRHKKDSPSGTAKFFHQIITQEGHGKIRVADPVSIRAGEVFGIHKISFFSESEWVSFEHHATDRSVFARGAVVAARWLLNKKAGFYSMADVLTEGDK